MTLVRRAAVAGSFYPADARALGGFIERELADARARLPDLPSGPGGAGEAGLPKALIGPHAGYVYSGPVAASAYAALSGARGTVSRVVLLGPAHRVPIAGLALPTADAFETPLGLLPVDRDTVERLLRFAQVRESDAAHAGEHSLEVHLPFLQVVLGEVKIVPLAIGDADPDDVADVIEAVWDGPETAVIVSSDLSHYESYGEAAAHDRATSDAIMALAPERIGPGDACGRNGVNGLLRVAERKGLSARELDLRSSGDTAGPRDQVVGYGAYVFD